MLAAPDEQAELELNPTLGSFNNSLSIVTVLGKAQVIGKSLLRMTIELN